MIQPFKYLSVCSGIEAATVAWEPLGWEPLAFSQFDPEHNYKNHPDFPSAVLNHHYPNVPNLGDMTKFKDWPIGHIDLLVGGTPCQSFSIAGLRKGMADPRGNLALTYLAIADRYKPRWIIWENVPGVLSSNGGRDFGSFLGGLGKLGYGFAYRVLDAQYVRVDGFERAVPQRRRRVFVVGYLGDWRRAAAVLFERESMCWDSPPRRQTRKDVAPTIAARTKGGGGLGTDFDCDGGLISHCLNDHPNRIDGAIGSLKVGGGKPGQSYPTIAFSCKDHGADAMEDCAPTLRAGTHDKSHANAGVPPAVTVALRGREGGGTAEMGGEQATALRASHNSHVLSSAVRRLTPKECARLQGFPDYYLDIVYRGKPAADGPKYKALGNGMAVNCMRWLGRRIDMVRSIQDDEMKFAA